MSLFEIGQEVYIRKGKFDRPEKGRIIGYTILSDYDSVQCQVRTDLIRDFLSPDDIYAIPSLQEIRDKKMTCFIEARCREDVAKMQKCLSGFDDIPNYAIDIWDMNIGRTKYETAICYTIHKGKINGWCYWEFYAKDHEEYGDGYLLRDVLMLSGEYATGGVVSYTLKAEDYPDGLPHDFSIEVGSPVSAKDICDFIARTSQVSTRNLQEGNKMKFKVGDKVIANKKANSQYGITTEGWIGEVIVANSSGLQVRGNNKSGSISDYRVEEEYFDLYTGQLPHKLRFETTEGERYVSHGKHKGETIPTITTTAYDDTMGNSGSATCDKADYNERQGIIEAIANMTYGNFDREYNKFLNHKKEIENILCKCSTCGKTYKTKEEARACEQAHIDRKKAKRENYLMRKAAKKRAREIQIEQMAKDMLKEQKV